MLRALLVVFALILPGCAAAQTTVFNAPFQSDGSGNSGYSARVLVPAISTGGSQIRLTVGSDTTGAFSASHVSVCVQASAQACQSTPVEVKFASSSGFSNPTNGGLLASDWTDFATSAGQSLLVIFDITSDPTPKNGAGMSYWNSGAGWNVISPSGSVAYGTVYGVSKVEVRALAPTPTPTPSPSPGITLFLAPTGSDNNPCSQAAPCLTTNGAWQYAQANLNLAGQSLTLQHADGTYPKPVLIGGLITGQSGPVIIQGNLSSPTKVVLTNADGPPGQTAFQVQTFAWVAIQGVQLQSVGAQVLRVFNNALVSFQNIDFGPSGGTHVAAVAGGRVTITGSYSISANANLHFNVNLGGSITVEAPATITLRNSPHFSQAFAWCQQGTYFEDFPLSFSGTGSAAANFAVLLNGVMNTGTGNTNHFPFNAPYSITSGGQYN